MFAKSYWIPFCLGAIVTGLAAVAPSHAEDGSQAFGQFVLEAMETAKTADEVADKIRARSIEIRVGRGEDAVSRDEREWYEHRRDRDRHRAKPGGGPPPWAPAHGYRRKFGAQEERALGEYTHRRIREGATGYELVVGIRDAIDRATRGEPIDRERKRNDGRDKRDDRRRARPDEPRDSRDHRSDMPRRSLRGPDDANPDDREHRRPIADKHVGKGRR